MSHGHEDPHRLLAVQSLGVASWAVLVEVSEDCRHYQLVLVNGEGGPSERVDCFLYDEPRTIDETGVLDAAIVIAHVVFHVILGSPPGCRRD